MLVGRDARKLQATEDSLRKISGGGVGDTSTGTVECVSVPTDVADPRSVEKLFQVVKDRYGHADVLVNNAGVFSSTGPIASVDPSEWWRDFEVNVKRMFLVTRAFLRLLKGPTGTGAGTESRKKAWIVTMATGMATTGVFAGMSSYSISKLAALKVGEYVAAEYPNVSIVVLQPGVVMTDMVLEGFKRFALETPELVGGVGVWLSTEDARFLSGRFVSANWSADELKAREKDIVAGEGSEGYTGREVWLGAVSMRN